MPDLKRLIDTAKKAMEKAYAPYSNFQVGAAILDNNGQLHAGCNVENSAYPIGCCAEQAAVTAMILGGGQAIQDIVVIAKKHNPCPPCGACRQVIAEHSDHNTKIHLLTQGDGLTTFQVSELLPQAFSPDHLDSC
ncbi:cytidine deaminase [Marinicella gelatinilytica]|uniref:cytidine deaminase n=1 Tax=Marinicella gelatinilytica TaxID=2996017 RepID=UPI002260950E|nr:cytidine deaminase [Marinicella gelatinilytica]MCX7543926.1 cytidine deaminase [Marinicella gelatinilytica]